MNRRTFVAGAAALVVPPRAHAQPVGRIWRIGFIGDGVAAAREADTLRPLRDGLRSLGYVEGRNTVIEARWSDGRREALPDIAAELVRLPVDVIMTHGVPGTRAAKAATSTIPIVVAITADIVGDGLVASLARPGGNVTGNTDQVTELSAKEVQLVTELLPGTTTVGILWDSGNPGSVRIADALVSAAEARQVRVVPLALAAVEQIEALIDEAVRARAEALIVVHAPTMVTHRERIARAALQRRLPAVSAAALFAEAGGLMAYGPVIEEYFQRAAVFVDRILRGARPADLPVEQATKFELVINLRTAKALRITVPPAVLLRANRVIE